MKAPRAWLVLSLVTVGALALATRPRSFAGDVTAEEAALRESKKARLYEKNRYDEFGHERLGLPREGEWLARFTENGQDEDDYKLHCSNRRSKYRSKIYVTEIGELGPRARAVQPAVRELAHAFFGIDVEPAPARALPKKAWSKDREQADGAWLLQWLAKDVPDDALVSVGLLDADLYEEGMNYIFGLGSLGQRVGVYSFARFGWGHVAEPLYRQRAFRLVAHEVGHVLSLEHCIYYRCVMNGANSLVEDDATPLHLCPVCLAKLRSNVGFDALARERELGRIWEREGIADEASWSKAQVAHLEAKK